MKLNEIIEIFSLFINWVLQRPAGGMILLIVCFIISIAIMIPISLFMFTIGILCHSLMGAILGFFVSLIIVYFSTLIGSILAFLLSRSLLKESILASVKPSMIKTRAILKALETNGFKIVLLLRLAPIIPSSILNYALGASNVKLSEYALGSIGLIPKQILLMYVAISVGSLSEAISEEKSNTTQLIIILSVGIAFGIIACVYIGIVAKREMNKILNESHDPMLGDENAPQNEEIEEIEASK